MVDVNVAIKIRGLRARVTLLSRSENDMVCRLRAAPRTDGRRVLNSHHVVFHHLWTTDRISKRFTISPSLFLTYGVARFGTFCFLAIEHSLQHHLEVACRIGQFRLPLKTFLS